MSDAPIDRIAVAFVRVLRGAGLSVSVGSVIVFGRALAMFGLDDANRVYRHALDLLQSALRQSGGVQTKAAEMLKVSYRSFRHLMKKYEL